MKMIVYTGATEVLVTTDEQEKYLLAQYFNDPKDRDVDEYDREVFDGIVEISMGHPTSSGDPA